MFDLLKTIGTEDIAYSWITELFANSDGRPLSAAFAVFTTSLVFLGSLLMAWHILIGIVNSAYTGKVLGERWHQIWAPLRVVLGFGLLVPVGDGFSTVHHLLEKVIGVAAVNLGNTPILAYIESATDRNNTNMFKTSYGGVLAGEVLSREICFSVVHAMNAKTVGRYFSGKPSVQQPDIGGEQASWFSTSAWEWDYGACGKITFNNIQATDSEMFKNSSDMISKFNENRIKATSTMIDSIRKAKFYNYSGIADLLAENGGWNSDSMVRSDIIKTLQNKELLSKNIIDDLSSISQEWNKQVSESAHAVFAKASADNANDLKDRIKRFGFMVAGSYERSLSAISGMTVSLASSTAALETPSLPENYRVAYDKGIEIVDALRQSDGNKAMAAGLGKPQSDDDWATWMIYQVIPKNFADAKIGKHSDDPIGDMIAFGHSLLNTASLALLGMALALGTAAAPSAITQAPSVVASFIASWLGWVVTTFMVLGFLYAFLLPMLPMIMVFIMGVSWLILYLEAAIAGVLWAFAFIRMDGQEFFDKNQSPGIVLLFNLLMRPALGMLAYCGMLMLQPALLNSLALIWNDSFSAQTGNISYVGFVWVWQLVAGLVLFGYLQWHLTLRLTGLIPTIPDRVGHWMGMQMHGYNDGHEIGGAMSTLSGAAVLVSRTTAQNQVQAGQMHQQAMDKYRQEQQRKQQQTEVSLGGKQTENSSTNNPRSNPQSSN